MRRCCAAGRSTARRGHRRPRPQATHHPATGRYGPSPQRRPRRSSERSARPAPPNAPACRPTTTGPSACTTSTLAREADVDRTAFYGNRPYAHLRDEFGQRLERLRQAGETPDPRAAQINRLKNEVIELKDRLTDAGRTIEELTDFRREALSRPAAQHEEIITLRSTASSSGNVIALSNRVTQASR